MDYKLMAVAVCNGDYTQQKINKAVWLIDQMGCNQSFSDAIRIFLESLSASDSTVEIKCNVL